MIYTDKYESDILLVKDSIVNLNKLSCSKILITGATGLICSAIVDSLMFYNEHFKLQIDVYAAGRNEKRLNERFSKWKDNELFHYVEYDALKDLNFTEDYDYIIHGACNANPALYVKEPVETMLSNIIGIRNLLEYAKVHNCRRILYISSSEVYGNKKDNEPYLEDEYGYVDILDSRSCYPSSKRASETLCAAYSKEYGVDYTVARPGHVYGPTMTANDNRASSQFPRDVLAGKDIIMKSSGAQLRSYCYVLDCASAILTILLAGKNGEAYNISNKDSVVSIREMAESFAKNAGQKIVFENPSDIEKMAFNKMNNSSLNASKLESLGWKANFNLEQGVIATLDAGRFV